jgi:hypothetical protein
LIIQFLAGDMLIMKTNIDLTAVLVPKKFSSELRYLGTKWKKKAAVIAFGDCDKMEAMQILSKEQASKTAFLSKFQV